VDVLWSAQPAEVALATTSQKAQVFSRDGAETTVDANGGAVPVKTSESPVYVVHKPAGLTTKGDALDTTAGTQAQRTASPEAMCAAAGRTDAVPGEVLYFPESGHNLYGAFKGYWEANGGINILGFPVTEEFDAPSSDGKVYRQQIFERARLEYHPENSPPADVQVGLLGVWVARDRNFPRSERPAGAFSGLFFAETGQALGTFNDWWSANGGLPAFGFPISPEMQEKNAADGKPYTVQYFERNRLELHPEFKGTQREVMLGLLGTEYLAHNGCK
jgi:hypothetical protein